MSYSDIHLALKAVADEQQAIELQRFFKTGPGEYGEGDVFMGLRMGDVRAVVKAYRKVSLLVVGELLASKYHEERMCGLLILVDQFECGDEDVRRELFQFYVDHSDAINNWDLVDVTTPKVVGAWLVDHPEDMILIERWVVSDVLWERRMAMLAMSSFIRLGKFDDPLRVAEILLDDTHDLMHKAVGWMLREVGKKDLRVLEDFLLRHYKTMPRTMLRYAIEKFSEKRRQEYLKGNA